MKYIWRGSFLSSLFFVTVIFAMLVIVALYGSGEGAGKTSLLLQLFSGIIFPSLLLILWLLSALILKFSAVLAGGDRPGRFVLAAAASAAVTGIFLDLMFGHGDVLFVMVLPIPVSASAAMVLFLNRRSVNLPVGRDTDTASLS